jgi:hypothetical protein
MRTSNKILLGIFILPLLILTLIHVTLYAKYKSGRYIAMKNVQEDRFIRKTLKSVNNIAVYGLDNFRIIPSDTFKLEIEKNGSSHFRYTINGDSLVIHGDSTVIKAGEQDDIIRSYQQVNLYLPSNTTITADNSEVRLEGSKDSLHAAAYHFILTGSGGFKVDENGPDDSTVKYFRALNIRSAYSSGIELRPNTHVLDLELSLLESAFTDNGASIDKLIIDTDKISNITLQGDNLKKVNLIKKP